MVSDNMEQERLAVSREPDPHGHTCAAFIDSAPQGPDPQTRVPVRLPERGG